MAEAVSQMLAGGLHERAGRWFFRSGIQEANGGVARYYRIDLRRNARISTEITGYAVSTFVWLFQTTTDEEYLAAARRAARFLVEDAWDRDLHIFPFEHGVNGDAPEALAYFFDSGIITRGLLALWRVSGEERWLAAARAAGESMVADFTCEGVSNPVLQLPAKRALSYEPRWSRRPGCYQLKSALAWHELAVATGEARLRAAFDEALAGALRTHDSFLPDCTPEKTMDRLHAYCYFLEGLLPAPEHAGAREALRSGMARVARHLADIAPGFVRSDVYAQLLRIRLWAESVGIPLAEDEARAEAEALPAFELVSNDPRIDGAFAFGRRGHELLPFANPVSTAFAAQACHMWHQRLAGRPLPSPCDLI
ncbi:MAG TPA: hypothetical protein VFL57_04935 [Bryobacteraceae bacterium]|nr:hypothetical protein [Bryobacteraceae bacterium]